MLPWDNSTNAPIHSNTTRNAFGEMIGQLTRKVKLLEILKLLLLLVNILF